MNDVSWPEYTPAEVSHDHKVSWITLAAMWWWDARGGAVLDETEWFSVSQTNNEEES